MHVDAPRLAVVDLAAHHRGVGVRLHLEARDAVPVDVAAVEVALPYAKRRFSTTLQEAFVQIILKNTQKTQVQEEGGGLSRTMPWSNVNTPTSLPW